MKKLLIFLILGLTFCTTACNKDNDEPKPEPPQYGIVSKIDANIRYSDTEQYSMEINIEYDTQNNITKIQYSGDDDASIFSYKREGDKLTVTETDVEHPNEIEATFNANLNAKGQIITAEYSYDKENDDKLEVQNIKCQYADNGDLIFCTNEYYKVECKFTWSNGNIVKNEYLSTDDSDEYAIGQQYNSMHENLINFDFSNVTSEVSACILPPDVLSHLSLRSTGYLGNKDKYLPAKIVWGDNIYPSESRIAEYTYEFNDNGLPNTIVITYNNIFRPIITMNITYKK